MEWVLRVARPSDAARLTEIAMESKASRGYSEPFMQMCRPELTITVERIFYETMTVAEDDEGVILGFVAVTTAEGTADLADLFVEPTAHSVGIGRALWEAACEEAVAAGCHTMIVEADPYAVEWYERRGAVVVGEAPSGSIPGRLLPVLAIDLRSFRAGQPSPPDS